MEGFKPDFVMEIFTTFIKTVHLNYSFFYHLIFVTVLYFVSKKTLFEPYIASMNQRDLFTKGRIENRKKLDLELQKNKELYEKKAQKLHKQFQSIFDQSKKKTQEDFLEQSLKIQKKEKDLLKSQRLQLQKKTEQQKELLKQSLPELSEELLNKIKS